MGEVGASHVGGARAHGVGEKIGLGVKAAPGGGGLIDAELESAVGLLGEIEELLQGVGVGDVQVVAGDETARAPALDEEIFEVGEELGEAAWLEEGDGEVDSLGALEILGEVLRERFFGVGDEGALAAVSRCG